MSSSLLKTKLFIPRQRAEVVPRPRLVGLLNQGLASGHRLLMISTPAGYGKSTLISAWLDGIENKSAWLSLDQEDNDPLRFWTYLVAAIRSADDSLCREVADILAGDQPPAFHRIATMVLNDLASIEDDIVVVLDDYHLIFSQDVHDGVSFLLDRTPPSLHLVIATRVDPSLPISRLRAGRLLTELRASDLRFTEEEATSFLGDVMGLHLNDADVTTLAERTEGWIVGLQLAALSLEGRENPHDFIESFSGGHQYIIDYLVDEVVGRQPEARQQFLLSTSLLDRFNASLCDAVLGLDDSRTMLEEMERSNLFVIPLDDHRGWYRYHHMFADLLRERLQREHADQVTGLHDRAAAWFEEHEQWTDALNHSFKTDDLSRAQRLQDTVTHEAIRRGQLSTFMYWALGTPAELIERLPSLGMIPAWAHIFVGQYEEASALIAVVREYSTTIEPSEAKRFLEGDLAVADGLFAERKHDYDAVLELCGRAVELMPNQNRIPYGVAQATIGSCHKARGDLDRAMEHFREAERSGVAIGDMWVPFMAAVDQSFTAQVRGDLREARHHCERALARTEESSGRRIGSCCRADIQLADLCLEQHQLDLALEHAEIGVRSLEDWWRPEDAIVAFTSMSAVRLARGEYDEAEAAMEQAVALDRAHPSHRTYTVRREAVEARLWAKLGRFDVAEKWIAELDGRLFGGVVYRERLYTEAARLRLVQGRAKDALAILEPLHEPAREGGRYGLLIQMQAIRSVALREVGRTEDALVSLTEALEIGAREGHVRPFIDVGEPMQHLLGVGLREAGWKGPIAEHARRVVDAFSGVAGPSSVPDDPTAAANESLREPLSERELEVLPLVAEGLSNRDIAKTLFVSVNTVKTHVHNISAKLAVKTRTQAAARAREIGLI